MTEEAVFPDQIVDGKNKTNVRCQFCNSLMLKAQEGSYNEQEVSAGDCCMSGLHNIYIVFALMTG